MNRPFALEDHTWKSTDFQLFQISLSAADLAERIQLPLHSWDEDGLGPASGFICQLSSGLVVLVQDFALAPSRGAIVHVDASEIAERGVQSPLRDVLRAFELPDDVVTWQQTEQGVENARLVVDACRKRGKRDAV